MGICKDQFNLMLEESGLHKKLSKEEQDSLFTSIETSIEIAKSKTTTIKGKELLELRRKIRSEVEEAQKIALRNALIDKVVFAKLEVEMQLYDNPYEAIRAVMVGLITKKKNAGYSVDAIQKGILGERLGGMVTSLEDAKVFEALKSKEYDENIIRAGYELRKGKDGDISKVKDDTAVTIATILYDTFRVMDLDSTNAGAHIHKEMMGTFFRSAHTRSLVLKKTRTEWIDYMLQEGMLDMEATFKGDPDPRSALGQIYESIRDNTGIISKGANVEVDGKFANARFAILKAFPGAHNVARRASRRSNPYLVFKDAEAHIKYDKEFGKGGLMQNIIYDMETQSRNLGLMRRLGTNPREMIAKLKNTASRSSKNKLNKLLDIEKPTAKEKRLIKDIQKALQDDPIPNRWMDQLDGTALRISGGNSVFSMAGLGAALRALQSMSKLGGATIAAFTDIPIAAAELRSQGVGQLNSYFTGMRSIFGRSAEDRKIARTIGLGMDGLVGSIHSKFGAVDSVPGAMTKYMQIFFKLNLMNFWNDSHRTGMAIMMAKNMAEHSRTSFDNLPIKIKQNLEMYGIGKHHWKIYQKYGVSKSEDGSFMTPENITFENVSKDDIVEFMYQRHLDEGVYVEDITKTQQAVKGKPGQFDENYTQNTRDEYERMHDALRDDPFALFTKGDQVKEAIFDLNNRLNTFYTNRADAGVIMPGALEKSLTTSGGAAGTVWGEASRYVMQFKAFPVTVVRRAMGREWTSEARVANLAQLIVGTTMFGYIASAAKDTVKGKTPKSWTDPDSSLPFNMSLDTLITSMTQGGGFGLYGDFFFGEYNRYGKSASSTFLGPTLGQFDDVMSMVSRAKSLDPKAADDLFRVIKNNVPGVNLFYTKWAMDYLVIYELQEMMNPGYLRRVERRIMKDTGQEFYFPPSEVINR